MDIELHRRAGTLASGPFSVLLTAAEAGWSYSALRVLELAPGETAGIISGGDELIVLPLAGSCTVDCDGTRFELEGREGVFAAVTDFAYVPRDSRARITSDGGGRFALPAAAAQRRLAPRYGPAAEVPVEIRGAGSCSRQVNNFCTPEVFETDKLIAVEVLTPAGNWSSYPPHKHDTDRPGESVLEEIYYFEIGREPASPVPTSAVPASPAPAGPGMGYHRVYGTADRPIDLVAEVRSGDVVLVPHGWHGPSMAPPGYDLYYLNVMAGPAAERAWLICDDPAHGWVRGTWPGQPADPRLPMAAGGRS
jgi:5-deoxy-glucuronate isomerase